MKCAACGYDDQSNIDERLRDDGVKQFIELSVVERGPFFAGTPYDWPAGKSGAPAVMRGSPTKILACPQCGTVRIDI